MARSTLPLSERQRYLLRYALAFLAGHLATEVTFLLPPGLDPGEVSAETLEGCLGSVGEEVRELEGLL